MEFNNVELRTLSMLGSRGTFGKALTEFAERNDKIVALSADLCNTSGLSNFSERFSERFINVGIAEQNLVGVAAGFADQGYIPFATTFANFAAMRACEFVRHFMGYMKSNIKLVGLSAGFGMELFGNTHYGVEDIAAIRSIPNITILSPSDGLSVYKCVEEAIKIKGPVYIRLTGTMNAPIIYKNNIDFAVGKANIIKDDGDIVMISTGIELSNVVAASKKLDEQGIKTSVVDMFTIKPIDIKCLDYFKNRKLIVSVEEHCKNGGLGSTIAEYYSENGINTPVLRIGTKNEYTKAGSYEYKIREMGLDTDSIVNYIKNINGGKYE